jgi:hypothetical protein
LCFVTNWLSLSLKQELLAMQAIASCSGGTTTAANDADAVGVANASSAVSNAQKDAIEPGAASGGASGEFSCGEFVQLRIPQSPSIKPEGTLTLTLGPGRSPAVALRARCERELGNDFVPLYECVPLMSPDYL